MRYLTYKLVYFLGFCCYFPYLLCRAFFRENGVRDLLKHLFPEKILPMEKPLLWAHAVSVGEVVALSPVLEALLVRRPQLHIILSTVTQTGFRTAQKLFPEAKIVFLPFDFRVSIRRILGVNAPSLVLLSEGDAWPSFLREMKKRGAFIALINGKMSDKSFGRYKKFQGWAKWLYGHIDFFAVQNEIMKGRYVALGITPERVVVTGNTKTDQVLSPYTEEMKAELRNGIGLSDTDHVVVLGSTHYPEENELVEALYSEIQNGVKVIVVPRHPERARQVLLELKKSYTALEIALSSASPEKWDILIVDRLGVLTSMYQIATLAIVCGSFVKSIGGHNIFESAACGVPTIVGPYMHSQKALFESALSAGAVVQVEGSQVSEKVRGLLTQKREREELKRKAVCWAESQRGASERTVDFLQRRGEKA